MKTVNKMFSSLLSVMIMMTMTVSVHGQEYVTDEWNVTFENNEMKQNFEDEDIDSITKELQPGDELIIRLTLHNRDETVDWYMSNEVLKTFEESNDTADGGAYSYKLYYINEDGEKRTIYDSEDFGGDDTSGGEGLHQATSTLENYFYLDTLENGQKGHIELNVVMDGETLNNDYQNTLARLQMNFAVEKATSRNEVIYRTKENKTPVKSANMQTGDRTQMLYYAVTAVLSAVILAVLAMLYKKAKKEE